MRKNALLFCLLFGLVALFAHSVQAADKTAADYWPMKVGNTWKMVMKLGKNQLTIVMKVVKVEKSGKESVSTITESFNGQVQSTEKYRTTPGGIYRISSGKNGSVRMEPALPIVKSGMKNDDVWDWNGRMKMNGQETESNASVTVSGPIKVKTPAGTYQTMKVHFVMTVDIQGQKMEVPNELYFAPGVGPVRQIAAFGGLTIDANLTSVKVKK